MGVTLEGLTELFVRLAETASPSGAREGVADLIIAHVARDFGFDVVEDEAAGAGRRRAPATSWCGCRPRPPAPPAGTSGRLGSAEEAARRHARSPSSRTWTPCRSQARSASIIENGVARSAGDTILGRRRQGGRRRPAGAARQFAVEPPPVDVDVVFTVCEEVGLRGAKHLDLGLLRAKAGFVFDSEGPVGTVIMSAPSLTLVGRRVPRQGGARRHRAREGAQRARCRGSVPWQRCGSGASTTRRPPTSAASRAAAATNVITERCRISGEARSRDARQACRGVAEMIGAVNLAAAEVGVDVSLAVEEDFVGLRAAARRPAGAHGDAAMAAAGVEARYIGTGRRGGHNVFNAARPALRHPRRRVRERALVPGDARARPSARPVRRRPRARRGRGAARRRRGPVAEARRRTKGDGRR